MISRCPSCGVPAPDEARQCRACAWDFIANKKGDKKPELAKKIELSEVKPKSSSARAEAPAPGPILEPVPDENPFALPVARKLGPKAGESLFTLAPAESKPLVPPEPEKPPQKEAPAPEPGSDTVEQDVDDSPAAAFFLPSSTKEIVVESGPKRAESWRHRRNSASSSSTTCN